MTANDLDLLRDFARDQSQDAFTALVQRHLDPVYCAALRQVRSPQLAEEVAQSVFTDLARNATRLKSDTVLTAWLYQVTRRAAIDVVRRESRRQLREQIASEMNAMNATADEWTQIEPLLDEAMHALDDTDRTAILLRYFENKSLREVGESLGTTDDAARKRVSRAVERLREFFAKHGVNVGTSGLVVAISANAVQAAPVGLAITISTVAALAGTVVQTSTAIVATKTIAMTTLQKSLIAVGLTAAVGTGIYESRQASALRSEVQTLRQQQAPLIAQIDRLTRERDDATVRQVRLQQESEGFRQTASEVPRLRGEVARLRAMEQQWAQSKKSGVDINDPAIQDFLKFKGQAAEIARYLEQMPDKKIPELKLLLDEDWLTAIRAAKLDTDADIRRTLSRLRGLAKNRVPIGASLNAFIRANNEQLPTALSQLKPYIKSALGDVSLDDPTLDSILERYALLRTGTANDLPPGTWIIAEKAPVNKDYDSRAKFGNGTSTIIGTGLQSAGDPDDKTY
jgi:RNA polymerase sigma factor (sigma-70 family)